MIGLHDVRRRKNATKLVTVIQKPVTQIYRMKIPEQQSVPHDIVVLVGVDIRSRSRRGRKARIDSRIKAVPIKYNNWPIGNNYNLTSVSIESYCKVSTYRKERCSLLWWQLLYWRSRAVFDQLDFNNRQRDHKPLYQVSSSSAEMAEGATCKWDGSQQII